MNQNVPRQDNELQKNISYEQNLQTFKDQFDKFIDQAKSDSQHSQVKNQPQHSRVEFEVKKGHCTAITFHPGGKYFVAAVGLNIHFYHILFGQKSNYPEEMSEFINLRKPITNNNNEQKQVQQPHLEENEQITAMQFSPHPINKSNHILLIGTDKGHLFIAEYEYDDILRIRCEEKLKDIDTNPAQYENAREKLQQETIQHLTEINSRQQKKEPNNNVDNQKVWEINFIKLHTKQISCILFYQISKEENQILTSSYDHQIKSFLESEIVKLKVRDLSIEGDTNNIKVLKEPKEAVFWITVSELDVEDSNPYLENLVSSGYDNLIYVWSKKRNGKWKFLAKYKRNELGSRIAYFGYQFIIQQVFQKNYINIFINLEEEQGNKEIGQNIKIDNIRRIEFNDQYKQNQVIFDNDKFPLLYNKKTGSMAIKQGEKIFVLKCRSNSTKKRSTQDTFIKKSLDYYQFNLEEKFSIRCSLKCTLGDISSDGENLVIYDINDKKIKVIKIDL